MPLATKRNSTFIHLLAIGWRLVSATPARLAGDTRWDRGALKTVSVARAIYLRLPEDARLWLRGKDFVEPDAEAIRAALTPPAPTTPGLLAGRSEIAEN